MLGNSWSRGREGVIGDELASWEAGVLGGWKAGKPVSWFSVNWRNPVFV
jgi:hypothetical protein